ncbi:unnamed protein product [Amoebophrya sp. A25]|nr:unnamed protein product [Amoebophrya sp. A25]|eukprot:GSA25T00002474001.1
MTKYNSFFDVCTIGSLEYDNNSHRSNIAGGVQGSIRCNQRKRPPV